MRLKQLEPIVEAMILQECRAHSRHSYTPHHFGNVRNASESDIFRALEAMVAHGKLTESVVVLCPEGHTVWGGDASGVDTAKAIPCPTCDDAGPNDRAFRFRFNVKGDWADNAIAQAAQKKTL